MKPHAIPLPLALLAAALVVGACTSMPSSPSVMVLPGTNKSFDQFVNDDHNCRQFALGQVGGVSSHPASGTASGTAAAGNSASAASHPSDSEYGPQYLYDTAYIQCMYANGHRVPAYGPMVSAPPATPPANYKPNIPPPAPAPQGHAP